jgi:hypothetical protein
MKRVIWLFIIGLLSCHKVVWGNAALDDLNRLLAHKSSNFDKSFFSDIVIL